MTASYQQHQEASGAISARCAVVTLSDTRNEQSDVSGNRIRELLEAHGHIVANYGVIPDSPVKLALLLENLIASKDVDVILTNGGTGVAKRDSTIAVVESKVTIPLPGFGELFRMLSYQQIGSGAMLSRAAGGVARGKLLFAMPGSTKAVELAMERLILPELRHLLHELRK